MTTDSVPVWPPRERGPLRPRRVLVVDDNRDAADTLAALLYFLGYEVRVAYDGQRGLAEVDDFTPDCAIWDISMPGMDGYTAARQMRELAHGRRIHLIALTALGTPADRAAALKSGFDVHMTKPPDIDALIGALGCA